MKKLFFLLYFLLIFENAYPNNFVSKLDAFSKKLFIDYESKKQSDALLFVKKVGYPFEIKNNEIYVTCFVELNKKNEDVFPTESIISSAGNIVVIKTPIARLSEFIANEAVKKVSFGRKYKLLLDSARKNVKADLVHSGINLPQPYTGKGVIVGIFDTGIDLLHPDFINENGTRVLYLWDMGETVSTKPPEGFDWGREYTKQEIDTDLQNVLQKDRAGHGTHVAGIAVGNGRGKSDYKGIAPEADIIIVNGLRGEGETSFSDADILSACNYIFSKADELQKPCVINLSLGTIIGSHDGEGLLSKALSNLASEKKGRAIVAAAGNEGELIIHSGGNVKAGNRYEILLYPYNLCEYAPELCPDIPNYFLFGSDIWSDIGVFDSIYVGIYSPENLEFIGEKGFAVGDVAGKVQIFDNNNELVGLVSISYELTPNSENILVFISNEGLENLPLEDYLWSIVLVTKKDGKFDSWSALPIGSQFPAQTRYQRLNSDNSMTINSPADGKKIVSVGAYISKNKYANIFGDLEDWSSYFSIEELAGFSSRGPSRDGRILPIISAPGMLVFSALSSSVDPEYIDSTTIDPSGIYVGEAGTSMSAPIVTGAIALLFEQNPNLSVDEIIDLLKISARKDQFTGSEPNNDFGWGKLDILRLLQLVTDVHEQIVHKEFSLVPNPASDYIQIFAKEPIILIEIFDVFGNLIATQNQKLINVSNLSNGLYLLNIKTTSKMFRSQFIKF